MTAPRKLDLHLALDLHPADTSSDDEVAAAIGKHLRQVGWTVIEAEAITTELAGGPDLPRIHHARQAATLALNHIRSEIEELTAYADDIEGNLESIESAFEDPPEVTP